MFMDYVSENRWNRHEADSGQRAKSNQQVGQELRAFLISFYSAYPQYENRELYLVGEGFSNNFIPDLAKSILDANTHLDQHIIGHINLKGIIINEPLPGIEKLIEETKIMGSCYDRLVDNKMKDYCQQI